MSLKNIITEFVLLASFNEIKDSYLDAHYKTIDLNNIETPTSAFFGLPEKEMRGYILKRFSSLESAVSFVDFYAERCSEYLDQESIDKFSTLRKNIEKSFVKR